jgi:hypothetical protein
MLHSFCNLHPFTSKLENVSVNMTLLNAFWIACEHHLRFTTLDKSHNPNPLMINPAVT